MLLFVRRQSKRQSMLVFLLQILPLRILILISYRYHSLITTYIDLLTLQLCTCLLFSCQWKVSKAQKCEKNRPQFKMFLFNCLDSCLIDLSQCFYCITLKSRFDLRACLHPFDPYFIIIRLKLREIIAAPVMLFVLFRTQKFASL